MVNLGVILLSAVFLKPVAYKLSVPKPITVETMVALEFSVIVAETVEINEISKPEVTLFSVHRGGGRCEGSLCEGYARVEIPPPKK